MILLYTTQLHPTSVMYFYMNIVFAVVKIFYNLHSRWKQRTLKYWANTMQFEVSYFLLYGLMMTTYISQNV
jgi:hypothetical protein